MYYLFSCDDSPYVGVDSGIRREVPEGQAPDLVVVAPVEIHLVDHCLAAFVFAEL